MMFSQDGNTDDVGVSDGGPTGVAEIDDDRRATAPTKTNAAPSSAIDEDDEKTTPPVVTTPRVDGIDDAERKGRDRVSGKGDDDSSPSPPPPPSATEDGDVRCPRSTSSPPPPKKGGAGGDGAHLLSSPSHEVSTTSVRDAAPPAEPSGSSPASSSPASAPEEGEAKSSSPVPPKTTMSSVDVERIAVRGKAFGRLLSNGSIHGHDGIDAAAETGGVKAAEDAPEKSIAGDDRNSTTADGGNAASAGGDVVVAEDGTTADGGNAASAGGDVVFAENGDGGVAGDPAAPPVKVGFRPKMPKKRASIVSSPTNPTLSLNDGSSSIGLEGRRHEKEEVEPSKKRGSLLIDPAEYHLKVCLPRRRKLNARQHEALRVMNKRVVGIYGSDPNERRGSSFAESYTRGQSGGSSTSRPTNLGGRGGVWDGKARRDAGFALDVRDGLSMGGSMSLTTTPVSTGRDNLMSLMPGMSPAIDPRSLSNQIGIRGRGDGRDGMNEFSDMMNRNPELFEHMMRMMKAGGGLMMGNGPMGTNGIGRIGDLRYDQEAPMNSLPMPGDGYQDGRSDSSANMSKYFNDALYGARGNVGMMGDESPHLPPKSPGNPKKTFLQRERVMDMEMRTHMREALFKKAMDSRMRVNLPSLTSPKEEQGNFEDVNRDVMCMESTNLMVDTVQKKSYKASLKSLGDEIRANKKKAAPPLPKKSKKTKFESNAEMENSTQEELKATILAVMGLPDKPKRPFSLYNLFFQLEREYILNEIREGRKPSNIEGGLPVVANRTGKSTTTSIQPSDPDYFHDPDIPARYSHLKLEKHWYSVGHKQKRKHRKTDGSCSFMELTRMVSAYWKTIDATDPYIKEYCQKLAGEELVVYKRENEKYKKAAKKADDKVKENMKVAELANLKRRAADEGASELTKKMKKAVDEDNSETSKDMTNSEGRHFNPGDQYTQNPYYGRDHTGRVGDTMDENGFMMGGGDMSRFAEMARMKASFPGFSVGGSRNDVIPRGMQATAMEARMDESRDGRGWGDDETALRMQETSRMTHARKPTEDQEMDDYEGINMPSDIQQKFAALAEAEARHRMQIEMQSVMMGNRNKGNGAWRGMDRATDDRYEQGDGMRGMPRGSTSPRSCGQNNVPQDFGGTSLMHRKFMETFGMDLSGGRGVRNVPTNRPHDGGADNPQEQEFDLEVDQFLSTLKEEIKENRRKQLMFGGGSGGSSVNAPFMRGGGGGGAPSKVGGGLGMEGGMPGRGGISPEMMKNIMAMNSGGVGRDEISPEMMRHMMGMNNKQMMDQMMRRLSSGSFSYNNSIGQSPHHPSQHMMEEFLRRQVGVGGTSQRGASMPPPPLWMNDDKRRQRQGRHGGTGQGDDNPALPEYGWKDEGS